MRRVVTLRTLWLWAAIWTLSDLLLYPLVVKWGIFHPIRSQDDFLRGDFDIIFFIVGLWIFASRRVQVDADQ